MTITPTNAVGPRWWTALTAGPYNGRQWRILALAAVGVGALLAVLPLPLAIVAVGGIAGGLVLLIQPLLGLALALLVGPLAGWEDLYLPPLPIDSGQVMLLATLGVWLAGRLARRRFIIPRSPLNVPLALFLATTVISLLYAQSFSSAMREILKWVEMALLMWLVVDLAGPARLGRHAYRWVTGALLFAAGTQAVIGILQFAVRGSGPGHFLIGGRLYRAYGTFYQPNPFGGFMAMMAVLALGALTGEALGVLRHESGAWRPVAWRRLWQAEGAAWRGYLLLAGLLCTAASIGSWSRGAWLGLVGALGVMVLLWPRRRRLGLAAFGVVLLVLIFAWQANLVPASIRLRVTAVAQQFYLSNLDNLQDVGLNPDNYAVVERLAHWQAALDMAADGAWSGVGFGNYEVVYDDFRLEEWEEALGHAHNYYLNLLAELGPIGLGAYLLFWTAVFAQTIYVSNRLDWPERGIAMGLVGCWTVLSIHHLVDNLYVNNAFIHLGVLFGLLQLLARKPTMGPGLNGPKTL